MLQPYKASGTRYFYDSISWLILLLLFLLPIYDTYILYFSMNSHIYIIYKEE